MSDIENIDKKIAGYLATLAPPGSGSESRVAIMHALASVLGMYLAGDLARLGRAQYRRRGQEMIDHMAGVAEISAVQLAPHRRREADVEMPRSTLGQFTSPPSDMDDPDGEKLALLGAMAALIHKDELELWQLPGWPAGTVRMVRGGLEIEIPAEPDEGFSGSKWLVTRLETEGSN